MKSQISTYSIQKQQIKMYKNLFIYKSLPKNSKPNFVFNKPTDFKIYFLFIQSLGAPVTLPPVVGSLCPVCFFNNALLDWAFALLVSWELVEWFRWFITVLFCVKDFSNTGTGTCLIPNALRIYQVILFPKCCCDASVTE